MFTLGNASEVTREELRFGKFIFRLRNRFSHLFLKTLEKQVVLKGIMTIEDWEQIKSDIKFDFSRDNYFTELKDTEILSQRINAAQAIDPFVGRYYSAEWVRKNVLKQSDEEIDELDEQIASEGESEMQQTQSNLSMAPAIAGSSQGGGSAGAPPAQNDDGEKIRKAKATYMQLIDKKPKSKEEYSKLQNAAQIIAKSDDETAKKILQVRKNK
jgi:hypothetical protein